MSSETINPITPERFALALQDLPVDALHAKAAELENNLTHLRHSNEQMLPFAESGDSDCRDAMFENLGVIGRIGERVQMIRAEVQRRGLPWTAEGEGKDGKADEENAENKTNGVVNGDDVVAAPPAPSGRLTDEELRRQLEAQMSAGDEDEGVHL